MLIIVCAYPLYVYIKNNRIQPKQWWSHDKAHYYPPFKYEADKYVCIIWDYLKSAQDE